MMIYLHLINEEVILDLIKTNSVKEITIEEFKYIKEKREACRFDEILSYDIKNEIYIIKKREVKEVKNYNINSLNTPYHVEKMKVDGVYDDFISYMDSKTEYDDKKREKEKLIQKEYEEALRINPTLSYEEFMSLRPTSLSLDFDEEPQPSLRLLTFKEKYLG